MFRTKSQIAGFIVLLLFPVFAPVCRTQDLLSKQEPIFHPHYGDSSLDTFDPFRANSCVLNAVLNDSGDDEGLLTGALVKEYLRDWTDSHRPPGCMEDGRTIGYVMAYIDKFGLYDLRGLAVEKALRLSKMPSQLENKECVTRTSRITSDLVQRSCPAQNLKQTPAP